jgi:hypothetical protein
VHRRFEFLSFLSISALLFIFSACTKIDTTTIGGELIPEVDNVNTFADSLDITSTQGLFEGIYKDTTRLSLTEEFALGKVNDPILGNTDARIFLQLKPQFFPYYIGKLAKDTITQADSVVLCLSYKSFWGDSTVPLQFQVYDVTRDATNSWDSVFIRNGYIHNNINFAPFLEPSPISSPKSIDIRTMGNLIKISKGNDSVVNQIRIKLSDAYRDYIFGFDSLPNGNKAFRADSLFRRFQNGFGIQANSGNALVYINILDNNTRLELHYKRKNGGILDTAYSSFYFNTGGLLGETGRTSSVANQIKRTHNTFPTGDQELYLETNPGSFANLYIPQLDTLSNKIIHRAELQIQQIPDAINDKIYTESPYMYVDLIDTGATKKWKPVYFDLNPSDFYDPDKKTTAYFYPANGTNLSYFGGVLKRKPDGSAYYNINITRHVQQIVTRRTPNYKMRLFPAHSFSYTQYDPVLIAYRNPIAYGRTIVGGGANPNPNYRMRLRIVYSNIK